MAKQLVVNLAGMIQFVVQLVAYVDRDGERHLGVNERVVKFFRKKLIRPRQKVAIDQTVKWHAHEYIANNFEHGFQRFGAQVL
jgi:hypothetical protein